MFAQNPSLVNVSILGNHLVSSTSMCLIAQVRDVGEFWTIPNV
jgi:hypothetical protein